MCSAVAVIELPHRQSKRAAARRFAGKGSAAPLLDCGRYGHEPFSSRWFWPAAKLGGMTMKRISAPASSRADEQTVRLEVRARQLSAMFSSLHIGREDFAEAGNWN